MSTTTDILFNSPALHSLKRDQLVKLCKIHSIKANGKNVDLIQRLRTHAATLPKDSPLSIAARSEPAGPIPPQPKFTAEEDPDDAPKYLSPEEENSFHVKPRPSEQWEMLDSIVEEDESSQETLRSQRTINHQNAGEFGTGGSKGSTVSSSIKALATSLGLKRSTMKTSSSSSKPVLSEETQADDELAEGSMPYSSLPESTSPPQTDHFTLESSRLSLGSETDAPLPGHDLRPGMPAPVNARLSMGLAPPATPSRANQPTTTIRLISNPLSRGSGTFTTGGENGTPQLKPFNTDFELTFSPVPGGFPTFDFGSLRSWPPKDDNDVEMSGIYPSLNSDEPAPPASSAGNGDQDASITGAITSPAPSQPFQFGSPQSAVRKFDMASLLNEVNQNLRDTGVDEIDSGIIDRLHPDFKSKQEIAARPVKPMPGQKKTDVTNKFDKLHEQEFAKMEGIDGTLKRKAQRTAPKAPEASSSAQQLTVPDAERVVGKKRKSMIDDDSVQGKGPRRPSVAPNRGTTTRVISNGRRAKVLPGAFGPDDDDEEEDEDASRGEKRVKMDPDAVPAREPTEAELQAEKEKEATQKQINAIRARRRSSVANGPRKSGRASVGRPRQSIAKPKPSRFGFLASAKSLVSNVWNRGKTPTAPSNIPKATPTPVTKPEPPKPKAPSLLTKKASAAPAKPTAAFATGARVSSVKPSDTKKPLSQATASSSAKGSVASSSRSRSPLPSFSPSGSDSLQSNASRRTSRLGATASSRMGSIIGSVTSRTSSGGVSSIGTKATGKSRLSTAPSVGSMGTKAPTTSRTSTNGSTSRMSTSSRLFAPTASSLAKAAHRPSITSVMKSSVAEEKAPPRALTPLTNTPATPDAVSPQSGKIFSKPLLLPQRSGIPTPMKQRPTSPLSPPAIAEDGSRPKPAGGVSDTGTATSTGSRSLNGRKPRISRSKVIAKLASQRSTSGSSVASTASGKSALGPRRSGLAPRASGGVVPIGANGGRTRSSLGVKAARSSYGGAKSRASVGGANAVMLSAKKRAARQSELEKRRSRVHLAPRPDFGSPFAGDRTGSDAMDCDA
ncbi:hypothetical protein CVT24_012486 [Panaeolus cyanescens]|uniref:SAP domain-containing protein n=1 Tax=Panaeolus cyanescens TaxID=181874 RepID=A0A409YJZ4_9AGAR|nr:hypothetical protein CVT24_012486 [Panaeolus cyanescens]